jgi:GntR family transcriptional regulator
MLLLTVNHADGIPAYLQIVHQIKSLIATSRLRPDDELPPVRVLAQQLVVNPNTVVRAYRELETSGLIYKRRGAGTYVSGGVTPYTDDECRRILAQRADALLVEARTLGYDERRVIELLRERNRLLEERAAQDKEPRRDSS